MAEDQKRILVIEDDLDLVDALERELRHSGLEVFTARDGISGMEIALQYQPQLIVLDLLIPKVKGLEMLEKLRQHNWGKLVKVIVLTNFEDSSLIQKANELGVKKYLVKANYSLQDVVNTVKNELS